MTTNCSSFVAIASGGYEQVTAQSTLEDGTTVDIVQDTERFYLLDAAGYLWILNLYALENDGYGCYITWPCSQQTWQVNYPSAGG